MKEEEDDDDDNTSISKQENNEGEKVKGGWVLCNFFGFCFVMGLFFPFTFFFKPKKFFIFKNLVITYKLSTLKGFYHKVRDFVMVLVFLNFCHGPKKIAKEKEKIEIKKYVACVNI